VLRTYAHIEEVNRPDIWITLRPLEQALADADDIDSRVAAGEQLPLAGTTSAVKDNIDVQGLPTTAGCPSYAYRPADDSVAVSRLRATGTVIVGKTNLDQFATGLVGTRSPYGVVRSATDPDRVAGGSSSGSAVAVALGVVDIALGTDTAGSGRIPAAFQSIVGIKPTRGLVSVRGVVPAMRGLDCVSVFAADVRSAAAATATLAEHDARDPYSRRWPCDAPLGLVGRPRVAVAAAEQLVGLSPEALSRYDEQIEALVRAGTDVVPVDISPLLAATGLLYDGAFVAARYEAVGDFIDAHPDDLDPTVAAIIRAARDIPAHRLVADQHRIAQLSAMSAQIFETVDALLLPTAPDQPLISAVAADPFGVNATLGAFTNFCNLLDLCAVAVPGGLAKDSACGVTVYAPGFHDAVAIDIASLVSREDTQATLRPPGFELAVFGAHLRGHPLNGQLSGGRLLRQISTAPAYRLFHLETTPPKPGLVKVDSGGNSVHGELWSLPATTLAQLLNALPHPMALGPISLADGRDVAGFLCQPHALDGARDITDFGSWPAYLTSTDVVEGASCAQN
jgi:allophanate hydrolase